jgi:hypothetical protein
MKLSGHIVEQVDDYLHGLLDAEDTAYVQQHVADCRICQVALEEAEARHAALCSVTPAEASEELIQKTTHRVQTVARRWRRTRRIALGTWALATAAAVLIIGGFHIHYANLEPTPYDLQVYGQDRLLADTTAGLRVRLFDRAAEQPMVGVPVEVELREHDGGNVFKLASFVTDANGSGSPRFALPDAPAGDYELRVLARTPGRDEVVARQVELQRSWRLMLSTDKPVYQPGQVIRIRSLALRKPDQLPVAGENVVFTVTDPKGNVIFKQREVSSGHGIAAADCALAVEILEGRYVVGCTIGDTESRMAVDVKKYVLPKFRIDVALDEDYYGPGDVVRGTVDAQYFFGKPVADGDVEVAVLTVDVGPQELARIAARTDEEGVATFDYRLPAALVGREQDDGGARVTFEVAVTDTAGQTQRRAVSRVVTNQAIRVEVIPEDGRLVRDVPNKVYVFATYADGSPAPVRLAISGVRDELATSELGTAAFEVTPTKDDEVSLTVRARDAAGLTGRREVKLPVGTVSRDFLVRTDRAVYDGGQTLTLTVLGGGVEPVFVDFIKDGQTLLTETVDVADGQGTLAVDLPAELFGTIELVAYRFGDVGLAVRKQRVIYVEQAGELKIAAGLDRETYRPGEQAELVLQLTDADGRPTPGAISLAAVDEAVFAVLEQAPGMERTFFQLEQKLLKPVYAVYNWTPNLDTSVFDPADRNAFEQALFSKTAVEDAVLPAYDMGWQSSRRSGWMEAELGGEYPAIDGPHTLAAGSFRLKVLATEEACVVALAWIGNAWWVLLIGVFVAGIVALFLAGIRDVGVLALALTCVALMVSIMLPSLSRAREQAKDVMLSSEMEFNAPSDRGTPLMALDVTAGAPMRPHTFYKMEAYASKAWRSRVDELSTTEPAPVIRVREWFPETLLWRPDLVTDDAGQVRVSVDLADSITSWRLTASAVSGDGRLGALNEPVQVFQPFFVDLNLPVALTRGDEVAMPVVVYNYLDEPQTVELTLDTEAAWFELLDVDQKRIDLGPGEVRSTHFRLRAQRVGKHTLQVTARGSGIGDAIKREVAVEPDGREVAAVYNGTLGDPFEIPLVVPAEAIEGSVKAIVKIYPSTFSQVLEGLEGIFQRPSGCFEQTSSTTYPNVLALDYLKRTQQSAPDVEAQARQYIHLGYQRLIGFEVDGGGFDWFGRPPANRTLTAYGLMEFQDMARVHDVDPQLIARTWAWLMEQQDPDGSWAPEAHKMHIDPTIGTADARLSTTAYIAWAVYQGVEDKDQTAKTWRYLLKHKPATIDDPYVLALVCNALLAMDPESPQVEPYLARLVALKQTAASGKEVWWQQAADARTTFYGAGLAGDIETTSLATLALLESRQYKAEARAALTWLVSQKDRLGTWHSTQATVLALKALLAGTGAPLGGDQLRVVELAVNGDEREQIVISQDQADVMRQISLGGDLVAGANVLRLAESSGTGVGYQVDFRYHVPDDGAVDAAAPLAIDIQYDRSKLAVGDVVTAEAAVTNNTGRAMPMVILDLPVAAGFAADPASFDKLLQGGVVDKYQVTARSVVVYLRELPAGKPLVLRYQLQATMPVKVTAPPARVYEYYDPDREAHSQPTMLEVSETALSS